MQLVSITLKNFQAHGDLTVKFAPSITTIKGHTDAGKSAVLRALRWVCLNDIAGAEFIKEGEKRVTVTLTVSSGSKRFEDFEIIRTKKRDGTDNLYLLDEKECKAFGQGVPPDIAQVLALNEINFQGQFDAPFWFSDTAGEVSRQLNSVIDLSIIDNTLANVGAEVRLATARAGLCQERLNEAKTQLEELAPQKDRVDEFKNVKAKQAALKTVTEDWFRLANILEWVRSNQSKTLAEQAMEGFKLLAEMLATRRAQRIVKGLEDIISRVLDCQAAAKPPPDFSPVVQAFTEAKARAQYADRLAELVRAVGSVRQSIQSRQERAQEAEAKFHAQVRGKTCPLCGQTIQLDNRT